MDGDALEKPILFEIFFAEAPCIFFHVTGMQTAKREDQIEQFVKQIWSTFYNGAALTPCKRWMEAFEQLTTAGPL